MIRCLPQMYTIGENMHPVPDAESGYLNGVWWGQYWNCPRAIDNTDKHSGTYSVKYTRNYGPADNKKQGAICQTHRVVGHGGTYKASGWVKAPAGTRIIFTGRLVNTNNTAYSEGAGANPYAASGNWEYRETLPWTLAGKPYTLGLIVVGEDPMAATGLTIQIDDIRIWRVS